MVKLMDNSPGEKWSLSGHIEKRRRQKGLSAADSSVKTKEGEETYLGVPVSELTVEEMASKRRVERVINDAAERSDPTKSKDLTMHHGAIPGKIKK